METQAIALVKPEYLTDVTARMSYFKMRENFTFMPRYHVTELYTQCDYDLTDFTKAVLESDWGSWSPRSERMPFIQSVPIKNIKDVIVRIILTRDVNERRNIYVYRETSQRYGHTKLEACVCLYMCDIDDNGVFQSDAFGSGLLQDIEYL